MQATHNLQVLDFAWILVLACAFQVSQGGQVGVGQGQDANLTSLETAPVKLGTAAEGWNVMAWVQLHLHRSEVTLGTGDVKDYYDVSLVDGYNLPLVAAPVGVHGACNATGCVSDINMGKISQPQLDFIENILRLLGNTMT